VRRPGAGAGEHAGRLWTRELLTAVVVNTLTMLVFYLLMTTMALYAAQRFAASDSLAGLASSMFIVGAVLGRLVAGPLIGSRGPRGVLVWALVLYVAMSPAYLAAADLPLLLAVRLLHGAAHGLANTATTTIAQSVIPAARRGEGTGYFSMSVPLAAALGPLGGLGVIDRWGYDALFWASAAVSVTAFLVALLLPERRPAAGPRRSSGRAGLVDRDTLPLSTVMLVVGVANASTITFTHPFADSLGIASHAGTFFVVNAAGVLGSRMVAGRVQDRLGDNWVMYPALLLYVGGLVLLSRVDTAPELLAAGLLLGLGFGSVMPTAQAAAVRLARPHKIGLAVATYYLMLDLGTGLGPAALGGLVTGWDYRVMYLVVAALLLAVGVQYHLVHGRHPGRTSEVRH